MHNVIIGTTIKPVRSPISVDKIYPF